MDTTYNDREGHLWGIHGESFSLCIMDMYIVWYVSCPNNVYKQIICQCNILQIHTLHEIKELCRGFNDGRETTQKATQKS